MPPGSPRRIQTTKQAKAAFAARGANYVSEAERRRLARGAELLARAERLKAQEARRKSGGKSRDAKGDVDRGLGSQRKLDRFGYASSQFHLGKFFGAGTKVVDRGPAEAGDAKHGEETSAAGHVGIESVEITPEEEEEPATSPVDASLFHDSIPSPAPPPPKRIPPADFSSFGSDDGLFDSDTLLRLDRAAEELRARRSASPSKPAVKQHAVRAPAVPSRSPNSAAGPKAESGKDSMPLGPVVNSNKRAMPPPPLPLAKKPRRESVVEPRHVGVLRGGLVRGVSMEDLEAVAMADFVLSQMPSR